MEQEDEVHQDEQENGPCKLLACVRLVLGSVMLGPLTVCMVKMYLYTVESAYRLDRKETELVEVGCRRRCVS